MKAFTLAALLMVFASSTLLAAPDGIGELQPRAVEPAEAEISDAEANELYSLYVDCLAGGGSEESCFRKWEQRCEKAFGGVCPLEERMFGDQLDGDEAC